MLPRTPQYIPNPNHLLRHHFALLHPKVLLPSLQLPEHKLPMYLHHLRPLAIPRRGYLNKQRLLPAFEFSMHMPVLEVGDDPYAAVLAEPHDEIILII